MELNQEWVIAAPPHAVLNRLETIGYAVVGMTSANQQHPFANICWTLHRPLVRPNAAQGGVPQQHQPAAAPMYPHDPAPPYPDFPEKPEKC
jgi:hypothetical protein